MRIFIKLFDVLIVLFVTINLVSCISNDDGVATNETFNEIRFNNKSYQIGGVFSEHYGNDNEFGMALFPSGIVIDPEDYTINGGNWYLEIELFTSDNTIEGTYACGVDIYGAFIDNAIFIEDNLQPGTVVSQLNNSGTVTIRKIGSEYEIIYDAIDENNVAFKGYYKGLVVFRE